MRVVTFVLIVLLAAIQYPLWWGHGGWVPVHDLEGQLARQKRRNVQLKLRNERLEGEVDDLRNGTAAIEERARYELGMVRDDEVFVQFVSPNTPLPPQDKTTATTGSTRGQMSSAPVSVVPEPAARAPRRKSTTTGPNRHTPHRPSGAHAR